MEAPQQALSGCAHLVQSPTRTLLQFLIIPALFLSYLPQYLHFIRYGTGNVSAWYIILLCLFSTLQLASRIINPFNALAVRCMKGEQEGEFTKFGAFSAVLEYFQVLAQWASVFVLMALYIHFRDSPTSSEYTALVTSESPEDLAVTSIQPTISTKTILCTTIIIAVIILIISLAMLLTPEIDGIRDFGGWYLQQMAIVLTHYVLTIISFALALSYSVTQIIVITRARSGGGMSLLSLGMQIPILVVLGVSLALRLRISWPGNTIDGGRPLGIYGWFVIGGNVGLNYGIMALGQLVLLVLCLCYRNGE